MDSLTLFAIAFVLGFVHSFDIDHLCAVGSFASNARTVREGLQLGLRWGCGHSLTVILLGTAIVLFKLVIPAWLNVAAELLVGIILIALGVWLLRKVFRQRQLHVHWHEHDGQRHFHLHAHHHGTDHAHMHKLSALGALHGFAGTSSIMVLIPISLAQSFASALAYVCVFGIGTIVSMSLFGACASHVMAVLQRWKNIANLIHGTLGFVSCTVGVVWIGNCLHLFSH